MEIRLVVTGRMYHLTSDLPDTLDLPDGATVADALGWIQKTLAAAEAKLPDSCLVAVNGEHLGTLRQCASPALNSHDELTLVTPVAGG